MMTIQFNMVQDFMLQNNHNKLILIRGLPGSGKSTFAKTLINENTIHLEADMFFTKNDQYIFDAKLLGNAHRWCQNTTNYNLKIGNNVVVSNTFTTFKEIKYYLDIGWKYGIIPTIITMNNEFESVHDVPNETLVKMKNRFQWDILDKVWNFYLDKEYDNLGAV